MSSEYNTKLDYCYKEYARLNDKVEELIKSIFEDFKLFGAITIVIPILKPIFDLIASSSFKINSWFVLLMGFISLRIVLYIIGFLILARMGYLLHCVHNLQAYELKIKKELGESPSSDIFNFNLGKEDAKFAVIYRLPFRAIVILLSLLADVIPFIILYFYISSYALVYLPLSLTGTIIYLQISRKVYQQYLRGQFL
jgi:hypothetical protein